MTLIDEMVGFAKANADAARTKDEQQTWAAHHRHALAAKAEIERLRAELAEYDRALDHRQEEVASLRAELAANDEGWARHIAEKFIPKPLSQ